jgi:hypothetical protein
VCLFLSLFALDAFGGGKTFIQSIPDFGIHVAFTGLAADYAYFARNHIDWILGIEGPLLIVGILFSWSWIHHGELRANA